MSETQQPLLKLAKRYISPDRANISSMLAEVKAKPETYKGLINEVDLAISSFNSLTVDKLSGQQRLLLSNVVNVKPLISELPEISRLEGDASFGTIKAGVKTFKLADELMSRGEQLAKGEDNVPSPYWQFHQQITDPEELAASLMLEMYGKFCEQKFPDVGKLKNGGFNILLALEEIIATNHNEYPRLFNIVRQWYSVDEGFSEELVVYVEKLKH